MTSALDTQIASLETQVQALVAAYMSGLPEGTTPDAALTGAPAAVTAIGTAVTSQEGQLAQVTAFLAMIYQALGQPLTASPQDVITQIAQGAAAVRAAAQAPPPPATPTAGTMPIAAAAGLALGALAAGGLGGWYAHGKLAESSAAKENPAPVSGPTMSTGYALKLAGGKWQEVMVTASVVKAARFTGYQHLGDGKRMAIFKTVSGGVYAQESAERRGRPLGSRKRVAELPPAPGHEADEADEEAEEVEEEVA